MEKLKTSERFHVKTINFQVEDDIYEPFKASVECNGMRVAGLFKLFMKSYATGNLLISNGEVVSKARPVGAPRKEDPPPSGMSPEKATPPPPKKLGWFEQDHSGKPLEHFDQMVIANVHPSLETKPNLEILTLGKITKKDFEDTIDEEYDDYREKFEDEVWEKEQELFCLRCAKKFLTQNWNTHRYEYNYLHGALYNKLNSLEQHYQWHKEQLEKHGHTTPKTP